MARLGADLMARALCALERGTLQFTPQPADGVTYAAKIDKAETRIDWTKPWQAVHDHIRGLSPFPGAWCELAGERVKVLRTTKGEGSGAPGTVLDDRLTIACGDGAVRIVELQKAGGRPMKAEEFLRGTPVRAGHRRWAEPCPATKSSSNTTARRSPAGSIRTIRRRCSARS